MIRKFVGLETERIWNGDRSCKLPPDIQQRAMRRPGLLDSATSLDDLAALPGNRLHALKDDRAGQHSIQLTPNGVYASSGRTETRMTSRSSTITDPDWLDNEHAGQLLVTEFLEPAALGVDQLADAIGIAPERIVSVIDGARPVDGELDLRLTHYFGFRRLFPAAPKSLRNYRGKADAKWRTRPHCPTRGLTPGQSTERRSASLN